MARVPLSAAAAAGARRWTRRRAVHAAFEIGVVLKGIDGVLEIAGAALLLAVTPRQIARVVAVREASVGRVPSRAGGVRCRGPRGTPPMLVPMLVAAVLAADPCAPVVDRAALAEEVGAAVRKAKPLGVNDVRYEPDEFRLLLVRADETACVVNLVNFAGEYCAEPASRRAEVVARFVRAVATSCGERPPVPATYAEAKPLLFPVVRSRSFLEAYPLADGVAGEPLGEDLLVALVRDLPDTMSYVSAGQLAGWNVTWRTAYADALANLRARSAEPLKEVSPGLWERPLVRRLRLLTPAPR